MDPILTAAAVQGSSAVAKSTGEATGGLVKQALGPAAEALGRHWGQLAEERLGARRLAIKAKRTREELGRTDGYSLRVTAQAVDAVAYSDDEMVTEYLSGVIASASGPADDRGVSWTSLISRLSADQLCLHYVLYSTARPLFAQQGYESATEVHRKFVLTPLDEVFASVGAGRPDLGGQRFQDALHGLMREGLVAEGYSYGPVSGLSDFEHSYKAKTHDLRAPFDAGIGWGATVHGVELFLWGLGHGADSSDIYLSADVPLTITEDEAMTPPPVVQGTGLFSSFWVERPKSD